MVKITPPQTIPSELINDYKSLLTLALPDGTVRKRFPFKLPDFQEYGKKTTTKQVLQRDRFKNSIVKFKTQDYTSRHRWFDTPINDASISWYYDYFIMSNLRGNADIKNGGAGVVKSIHQYSFFLKTAPVVTYFIAPIIDFTKTMAVFNGSSFILWSVSGIIVPIIDVPCFRGILDGNVIISWLNQSKDGIYTLGQQVSVIFVEFI